MNPLEALTDKEENEEAADAAPTLEAFLRNPIIKAKPLTYARELMLDLEVNGEYKGPPRGSPENPNDDKDPNEYPDWDGNSHE